MTDGFPPLKIVLLKIDLPRLEIHGKSKMGEAEKFLRREVRGRSRRSSLAAIMISKFANSGPRSDD
jgi:hypothetical protein